MFSSSLNVVYTSFQKYFITFQNFKKLIVFNFIFPWKVWPRGNELGIRKMNKTFMESHLSSGHSVEIARLYGEVFISHSLHKLSLEIFETEWNYYDRMILVALLKHLIRRFDRVLRKTRISEYIAH